MVDRVKTKHAYRTIRMTTIITSQNHHGSLDFESAEAVCMALTLPVVTVVDVVVTVEVVVTTVVVVKVVMVVVVLLAGSTVVVVGGRVVVKVSTTTGGKRTIPDAALPLVALS
jgi:hypothetical protein